MNCVIIIVTDQVLFKTFISNPYYNSDDKDKITTIINNNRNSKNFRITICDKSKMIDAIELTYDSYYSKIETK